MSGQLKATFFSVNNPEGHGLAEAFLESLSGEHKLSVEVAVGATQTDLYHSCLKDDIVFFDASIEPGHNYGAATAQPMSMDRVLVVSRTYLPLNFYGLREGGAPEFPRRTTQSNEEILKWLRAQVSRLLALPRRPDNHKGFVGSLLHMREAIKDRDENWKQRGQIFISYRSCYLAQVQKLRQRIERGDFHDGEPQTVVFLTPGELVYEDEVLTEQRHWQLASMIDRKIGVADELWIYDTSDYYDSWWTLAELFTVSYRRASGASAPKVRAYSPEGESVRDLPTDFLPVMRYKQKRRMARWYANTDPGTMGPEALLAMRFYAQLPLIGRFSYFHDHVWSEDFWDAPILPCNRCGADAPHPSAFNLDAFLWLRHPRLVRLQPQQLDEACSLGEVACPACQTPYQIVKDSHPRYLWMPVRAGRPTGPDGSHLIELPIFRISQ